MSNNLPPPLGYTITPPAGSMKDVYTDYRMVDKAVSLTKSAIQQYIDSFLNPLGANRKYLTSSMSPVGIQFVTDLTYDEQMKANPNLRKTYLAKFFVENTGRLPSILIIDTGIEIVDVGLNDLVAANINVDGSWEGIMVSIMKINLSITIATLSEEDTSTLATMVATMFAPLATVINNCILRDTATELSPWEVRLPLSGITLGQGSSIQMEGDTKTTIWTRAIDFTSEFETHIGIKQPPYKYLIDRVTVNKNDKPVPVFMNLQQNQNIPLGIPYPLMIEGMLASYYLGVSDPRIALVTSEPPYVLQPKAQGQCLLLVLDRNANSNPKIEKYKSPNYVADVSFNIVR